MMYYFSGGDDVEAGRGRPLLRRHKERHVLVLLIGNKPIEINPHLPQERHVLYDVTWGKLRFTCTPWVARGLN